MRRIARLSLAVALICGGCAASSELSVPNVHTVTPGVLIRGGQPDEAGLIALRRVYGVTTDVNLNDRTAESEAALCRDAGLNYVALPSNPFRPDPEKLATFLRVIAAAGGTGAVYVHCKDGMDRTGFAVATYRIVDEGWTADRANDELRHWQAWPHTLIFFEIGPFVRSVERHRSLWQSTTRPASANAVAVH
jgi:protein tyrosine/serine phosphatase